jgi:hypothetical protein
MKTSAELLMAARFIVDTFPVCDKYRVVLYNYSKPASKYRCAGY